MITTKVRLSHCEKYWLLNLELAELQIGHILRDFLGEASWLANVSRANFNYVFNLSNVKIPFLKKLKLFLVKGFYLNFVKKVKVYLSSLNAGHVLGKRKCRFVRKKKSIQAGFMKDSRQVYIFHGEFFSFTFITNFW